MFAITFSSVAYHVPTRRDLEYLFLDARSFNARVEVTGALLLSGITFYQYLEGTEAAVETVYERIKLSGLHHGITDHLSGPIEKRCFDRWYMGFTQEPEGQLLARSQDQWRMFLAQRRPEIPPRGAQTLLAFWDARRSVDDRSTYTPKMALRTLRDPLEQAGPFSIARLGA